MAYIARTGDISRYPFSSSERNPTNNINANVWMFVTQLLY